MSPTLEPARVERIAFVTPPSRRPVHRDFLQTSTSKGAYYWAPVDLWVQGAHVAGRAQTALFEGVRRRPQPMLDALARFRPDLIVTLIGGFSFDGDVDFVARASARTGAGVVVGGEAAMLDGDAWRRMPWAVARMAGFAGDGLRTWLDGRGWGAGFAPVDEPRSATLGPGPLRWGAPPAWSLAPYRYPLLGRPFATVLTSYGCPYRCGYCSNNRDVMGATPRDDADVFAELDVWAERGVRWLHFRDVNFGGTLARAKRLLEGMVERRYRFRFNVFLRPESIDAELTDRLRAAGCVQVQMGVESANAGTLRAVGRNGNASRVEAAFKQLRRAGIRRGAHFVLGLPGETAQDFDATVRWARDLAPDYASFNLAVARAGTRHAATHRLGDCSAPDSRSFLGDVPLGEANHWCRIALKRVYLDPRYPFRLLRTVWRTPRVWGGIVADGVTLLRSA